MGATLDPRIRSMSATTSQPIAFGPFVLDVAAARLTRAGSTIGLTPRSFDLLAYLARRPGQLVGKDELLDQVWGRRFITEGVVKTIVSELRAALDDDAREPRYIETVPRRGYRFVATVAPQGTAATAAAGAAADVERRVDLPGAGAALLGRDGALRQLVEMLAQRRLVTLVGPGGVGKTRLALAAARSFQARCAEGVRVLELAAFPPDTQAAQLRAAVAQALRLGTGADRTVQQLAQETGSLQALLLIDNAEHLATGVAELVDALLRQESPLKLLVTSQEPLLVAGEQLLRLAPLEVPPAGAGLDKVLATPSVQLLADRVAMRLSGFELTDALADAAGELCRLLDGLPLAIELAAARVPVLGLNGLLERLRLDAAADEDRADALQLLAQRTRGVPQRHRSLRDTLAWSHSLLTDDERRVFRRLAVFKGSFTAADAEAVCADPGEQGADTLDALVRLVDKSLVVADGPGDGRQRLRLLEGPRHFAAEQLQAAHEVAATRRRHAERTHRLFARAFAEAEHVPALDWLARYAPEVNNLRDALRWVLEQPATSSPHLAMAADLLLGAERLWSRVGGVEELFGWYRQLEPRLRATGDGGLCLPLAIVHAACAIRTDGDWEAALADVERAVQWAGPQRGDRPDRDVLLHVLLQMLYLLLQRQRPQADRQAVLERMRALERPTWGRVGVGRRRLLEVQEADLQQRPQEFLRLAHEVYDERRRLGQRFEAWNMLQMLMPAESLAGSLERAAALGAELIDEIRAAGYPRAVPAGFRMWLQVLAEQGDTARTRSELADHAAPMLLASGRLWSVSLALPWLAWHQGRPDDASRLWGWAAASIRRKGAEHLQGESDRRSFQRLRGLLEARLGVLEAATLIERGQALDDSSALALALDTAAR